MAYSNNEEYFCSSHGHHLENCIILSLFMSAIIIWNSCIMNNYCIELHIGHIKIVAMDERNASLDSQQQIPSCTLGSSDRKSVV